MSGWVRVRHAETGGEAIIPADALPAQQARGFEPLGEPAGSQFELVVQAEQERADAAEAAQQAAVDAAETAQDGTIADVLAAVGEDPVAARAALDAEQAKDKPRTTLVGRLEHIADGTDEGVTGG